MNLFTYLVRKLLLLANAISIPMFTHCISIYIYLSIYLSIYIYIYICTTVAIPTFMVGGIPQRDEMTNSGTLDHSGVLRNQRIYLRVKIADLMSYSQELSFRFQKTQKQLPMHAFARLLGRGQPKKFFWPNRSM